MDQAAISATAGQLEPMQGTNLQGYQTQLESATMEIKDLIEPLAEAAKCHPEKLGHNVATLSLYFDPVSRATIGAASKLTDMNRQQDLFSQVGALLAYSVLISQLAVITHTLSPLVRPRMA